MTGSDIDQLIEEGLTLYGQGDLDGALLAWEKALAADPENAQANSYVDYVRQNYDLLTGQTQGSDVEAPFGIEDEPYQIEIEIRETEELPPAKRATSDVDEGWFMDDDESPPKRTLELEADEPPAVSFEDETREYQSGGRAGSKSNPPATEFHEFELTPGPVSGFSSQPTNLRERETGFVKPTAARSPAPAPAPDLGRWSPGGEPIDPFSTMSMPKLTNMPAEASPASSIASISLSYDEPAAPPETSELITSLPTPTPRDAPTRDLTPQAVLPVDAAGNSRTGTADLPPVIRPPAITDAPPIALPGTLTRDVRTRDFDAQPTNPTLPKPSATPTRELRPSELSFGQIVSAPTRDLGIRPLGVTGTATLPDEATLAARREAPTTPPMGLPSVGEGTRADVILPFDPIDARTAQILDEIDDGAPPVEAKEDKTRRRITTLFEKALAWSQSGELDKAVAAIDLALSEDPNSALGQKLIHRHRDQMLGVFQAFLGDLQRQPVLARPLHELASAPISPRAAFLLSRIDGTLSMDELLDVSGMPRIEAYRYLCQLFLRGILK